MANIRGDVSKLTAYLTALRLLGRGGVKRVSRAVSEDAKTLVDDGFARGIAPNGTPWKPLRFRAGQPLRDTSRLQRSLVPVDTGRGFRISTSVRYAAVHQYGAIIKAKNARTLYSRKSKVAFGPSVKVPARPFLPRQGHLPPRWSTSLNEAAQEAIQMMLRGKR
jgi:phage gpG-like protein